MDEWLLVLGSLGLAAGAYTVVHLWIGTWEGAWVVHRIDREPLAIAAGLLLAFLLIIHLALRESAAVWLFLVLPLPFIVWHLLQHRWIARREAAHRQSLEARRRAMLARDSVALYGYECLADTLAQQGRLDDALGVLLEWWWRDQDNVVLQRRIRRLQALLTPAEPGSEAQTGT